MKKSIYAILELCLFVIMLLIVSAKYIFFKEQPDNFCIMAILVLAIANAERSIIEKINENEQRKNNQN